MNTPSPATTPTAAPPATPHTKPPKPARTIMFLTVMLVVSVALNVGLAHKVREFTSAQEAQLARLEARRLKSGTSVPPLTLKHLDQEAQVPETISYAGTTTPTVLYVLSPTCGWCAKNKGSIRQLIAEKGDDYRFIGVSLIEEGAARYATEHALGAPLYAGITEEQKTAYKMGGTPQTIVISPKGVVVASWHGAYLGKQKKAIEKFFDVDLPEIKLEKRS